MVPDLGVDGKASVKLLPKPCFIRENNELLENRRRIARVGVVSPAPAVPGESGLRQTAECFQKY